MREGRDLLVVNGSDLLWCLDEAPAGMRTIAIVHNQEAQLYAEQVASIFPRVQSLRCFLLADYARLQRFETEGLRRARAAIFLSESDAAHFSSQIPELDYQVVPPQFSAPPKRVHRQRSQWLELGLLANFHWWPNREGTKWFIRDILAQLPTDVRLHLFGNGSLETAAGHPRIVAHGFVDDLEGVWRTCDWMVIPIRHGSGVSVKTAECLYNGMPIISTSFGLRGLPGIEHPQIIQLETAEEWVSFLSAHEARILCKNRLPLSVSRHFELEANLSRLTNFVSRVLTAPLA